MTESIHRKRKRRYCDDNKEHYIHSKQHDLFLQTYDKMESKIPDRFQYY